MAMVAASSASGPAPGITRGRRDSRRGESAAALWQDGDGGRWAAGGCGHPERTERAPYASECALRWAEDPAAELDRAAASTAGDGERGVEAAERSSEALEVSDEPVDHDSGDSEISAASDGESACVGRCAPQPEKQR